jgi:hypothetical protein
MTHAEIKRRRLAVQADSLRVTLDDTIDIRDMRAEIVAG